MVVIRDGCVWVGGLKKSPDDERMIYFVGVRHKNKTGYPELLQALGIICSDRAISFQYLDIDGIRDKMVR